MIQFDVLKYVPNKLKQDTGSFATFEENRGIGDDLKGRKPIIFDMRNIYSPTKMKQQGFKYFGVGR